MCVILDLSLLQKSVSSNKRAYKVQNLEGGQVQNIQNFEVADHTKKMDFQKFTLKVSDFAKILGLARPAAVHPSTGIRPLRKLLKKRRSIDSALTI